VKRRLPSVRAAGCILAGLLSVAGCGGPAGPEIPLPELEGVDPDIVQAVEQARAAVQAQPEAAAAWGALGDRYYAHEWYDEAAACFARAEQFEPEWFNWPYRLGHSLFDTPRRDEAPPALERALALDPRHAPGHEALARLRMREGDLAAAERHYALADGLDPRSSHAALGRGQVALARGDLVTARRFVEQALRRNPDHGEAHKAMAQLLFAAGEPGAQTHVERAQRLPKRTRRVDTRMPSAEPRGAVALTDEGKALDRSGQSAEAERYLRRAVEVNPDYQPARYHLGTVLAKTGRLPEAAEHLVAATRLKSSHRGAWESLGFVLLELRRPEPAAEALRQAATIDPSDPHVRFTLGTLEARLGRPAEGVVHLEAAFRLDPERTEALVNLGIAQLDAGDAESAAATLAAARERLPDDAKIELALGRAHARLGRNDLARRCFERALELQPGWDAPRLELEALPG
jgi:tetratricopeptide (TPR) repeat protein